ncbi:MAG: flagellin FliC [Deltaproteobacteria bacterium]|nr:flagellin FliC [Deltaproteobacteria bacterium]MBN2671685.1 flagellin FliC [Deltaproteobacteria bacterium]
MGLVINTNIASMNAQRNLSRTEDSLNTSMARLSSGMRITASKDDAAGLAISEKLRAQIRGLGQAERNAQDGISLVQVAEGALNEVGNILIRCRELAVQAATGTLGSQERGYLNNELNELMEEIDRIAGVTDFNGMQLLDGTASFDLQVGIRNHIDDRIQVVISTMSTSGIGLAGVQISGGTGSNARNALTSLDTAINSVSKIRGDLGAIQNRLASTIKNLATQRENLSAANSRIRDVDVAEETVTQTRSQILMQAGISVLSQANQLPQMALALIGQ